MRFFINHKRKVKQVYAHPTVQELRNLAQAGYVEVTMDTWNNFKTGSQK